MMSYYVEYNPELKRKYPSVKKERIKHLRGILTMLMFIALAYFVATSDVPRLLIPGDLDITVNAVQTMVEEVSSGVIVRDAFANFCKDIILSAS